MDREGYSPFKERIENKVVRIEEKVDEALYLLKYLKQRADYLEMFCEEWKKEQESKKKEK